MSAPNFPFLPLEKGEEEGVGAKGSSPCSHTEAQTLPALFVVRVVWLVWLDSLSLNQRRDQRGQFEGSRPRAEVVGIRKMELLSPHTCPGEGVD